MRYLTLLCILFLPACAHSPAPTHSGFLSSYADLESVNPSRSRFISPALDDYHAVLVDPVEVQVEGDILTPDERTQAAAYFDAACRRIVTEAGIDLADEPAPGVARVRLALTDIAKSTWWAKIHPGARFAGAGTGGAAMEGEVVDSLTGVQLAAAVQADAGNQFNLTAFSTLDDVKGAIDKWAKDAAEQLRKARAEANTPAPMTPTHPPR
ncbi:MAG: DUF3313 domain-containing protein [Phycisphaerales bacterium]|nr:DUF3313 domain-containing protein [Phycisphaerales bacterium]